MSGFHRVCTLCAGFLLPWLLSSSSSIPSLHLLACFKKGSVPDANPTGNGLGCTSQWCQGAARGSQGVEEMARQQLPEVFVEQGVRLCSPSSPQAPGTMETLPETAGAKLSPRRESMTNHSLACKETTDQWSGCHWLLVQSKVGQKHLNKLGAAWMFGMLSAWAGPASCHPQLHNLQKPSQDFGHL